MCTYIYDYTYILGKNFPRESQHNCNCEFLRPGTITLNTKILVGPLLVVAVGDNCEHGAV